MITEKQLDTLRFKFGGDWYDNWWCSIFSWVALHEGEKDSWWEEHYHKEFFDDINSGWLEMYPPKKKTKKKLSDRSPFFLNHDTF